MQTNRRYSSLRSKRETLLAHPTAGRLASSLPYSPLLYTNSDDTQTTNTYSRKETPPLDTILSLNSPLSRLSLGPSSLHFYPP